VAVALAAEAKREVVVKKLRPCKRTGVLSFTVTTQSDEKLPLQNTWTLDCGHVAEPFIERGGGMIHEKVSTRPRQRSISSRAASRASYSRMARSR